MASVRLACVRHAASVRPEPGSNSPIKLSDPWLVFPPLAAPASSSRSVAYVWVRSFAPVVACLASDEKSSASRFLGRLGQSSLYRALLAQSSLSRSAVPNCPSGLRPGSFLAASPRGKAARICMYVFACDCSVFKDQRAASRRRLPYVTKYPPPCQYLLKFYFRLEMTGKY